MRSWLIGGLVAVALIFVVLVVVPASGGPKPGEVFDKPTDAECEEFERVDGAYEAPLRSAKSAWVWAADGYGWGCRYEYADGTTSSLIFPRAEFRTPRTTAPDRSDVAASEPARCKTLDDLVIASDTIVVGRVTAVELSDRPGTDGLPPPTEIDVEVEETLKGDAADQLTFLGGDLAADGSPVRRDGIAANGVGDSGIYFLWEQFVHPDGAAEYTQVNPQGRFLRDGDRVRPGHEGDEGLSREQSQKSFAQLRQDILDSVDATRSVPPRDPDTYHCAAIQR